MNKVVKISSPINDFKSTLYLAKKSRFSGRLIVTVASVQIWNFYFQSGLFVWASEASDPHRHSYRLLAPYRQLVDHDEINEVLVSDSPCRDFSLLVRLARQQKIDLEQIVELVETNLTDILFDICQTLEQASNNYLNNSTPAEVIFQAQWQPRIQPSPEGVLPSSCLLPVESLLQATLKDWAKWVNAGLAYYSPNLIAIVKEPSLLQEQTSPAVYDNLVKMINGKRSLKDMATLLQWDKVQVAKLLLPYVRRNLILLLPTTPSGLASVEHFPSGEEHLSSPNSQTSAATEAPLVICVDDNPEICEAMESIIEAENYRCQTIQDVVQVLPTLLKHKPDAIFLDLIMPIANGYEICAKVRKISMFQDTPIIILSGNDGIVDRVRAKRVGATDFLTKPVDPRQVRSKLRKYVSLSLAKTALSA